MENNDEKENVDVPVIEPKEKRDGNVTYENSDLINLRLGENAKKMDKIDKDTLIMQIITAYPELAQILIDAGMHCVGCPASSLESLENGCKSHGFDDAKLEELIKKLNEMLIQLKAKENKE